MPRCEFELAGSVVRQNSPHLMNRCSREFLNDLFGSQAVLRKLSNGLGGQTVWPNGWATAKLLIVLSIVKFRLPDSRARMLARPTSHFSGYLFLTTVQARPGT